MDMESLNDHQNVVSQFSNKIEDQPTLYTKDITSDDKDNSLQTPAKSYCEEQNKLSDWWYIMRATDKFFLVVYYICVCSLIVYVLVHM